MKFPDTVTILRSSGEDEYGNPSKSWEDAEETSAKGFQYAPDAMLMPASADIREGDRVRVNGQTYNIEVEPIRSPAKRVMWQVKLRETA